jgi:hypothetical protein
MITEKRKMIADNIIWHDLVLVIKDRRKSKIHRLNKLLNKSNQKKARGNSKRTDS